MIGIAGTLKNIFGDQGNMQRNFWEHWNLTKVDFREHLNLLLRNKAETNLVPRAFSSTIFKMADRR